MSNLNEIVAKLSVKCKPTEPFHFISANLAELLAHIQSASLSKDERANAIHITLFAYRRISMLVRQLAVMAGSDAALQQLIDETRSNCALFRDGERIHRGRIQAFAAEMDNFPMLVSVKPGYDEKVEWFKREIRLGSDLTGGRRSARAKADAIYRHAANRITDHLDALMRTIEVRLKLPAADGGLDIRALSEPYQKAIRIFRGLDFNLRRKDFTKQNWFDLWTIIHTLIVTNKGPEPSEGSEALLWHFCEWRDFYGDVEMKKAITAKSHRRSVAILNSHIRENLRKAIAADLGIAKLQTQKRKAKAKLLQQSTLICPTSAR